MKAKADPVPVVVQPNEAIVGDASEDISEADYSNRGHYDDPCSRCGMEYNKDEEDHYCGSSESSVVSSNDSDVLSYN